MGKNSVVDLELKSAIRGGKKIGGRITGCRKAIATRCSTRDPAVPHDFSKLCERDSLQYSVTGVSRWLHREISLPLAAMLPAQDFSPEIGDPQLAGL